MEKRFTQQDTNIIKGAAACLLLWHHLFYDKGGVLGKYVVMAGILAKVCVAIFVILSGYGLSKSFNRKQYSLKTFYYKHFKKLYINYWIMWIIFVPLGIVFFQRSLESVYGNHITEFMFYNLLGIHQFLGIWGYNVTWWFMSLIIGLYLLFPLLNTAAKKFPVISLCISFLLMFAPEYRIGDFNPIAVLGPWLFPFIVGVVFAQKNLYERIVNFKADRRLLKLMCYLILLVLTAAYRQYGPVVNNIKLDAFFGSIIILICIEYISQLKYVKDGLAFIGIHSFNIFLFHTFIYFYYFKGFIFSTEIPFVIFAKLLIICLLISVVIEKTKSIITSIGKTKPAVTGVEL